MPHEITWLRESDRVVLLEQLAELCEHELQIPSQTAAQVIRSLLESDAVSAEVLGKNVQLPGRSLVRIEPFEEHRFNILPEGWLYVDWKTLRLSGQPIRLRWVSVKNALAKQLSVEKDEAEASTAVAVTACGADAQPHTSIPSVSQPRRCGRPSSEPLVLREFDRLVDANETVGGILNQGRVLSTWLAKAHPDKAQLKPKSVENLLRKKRRNHFPQRTDVVKLGPEPQITHKRAP